MVSFLKLLGVKERRRENAGGNAEVETIRAIATRLDGLEEERANLVAAFAAVLMRAARADLDVSGEESARMVGLLRIFGGLTEEHARLAVELAAQRGALTGNVEEYLATREFRRIADREQRERLLHSLFAVCAADDSITLEEEEEVRQIASELGFEHREYTAARAVFRDQREVLRGLPGRRAKE
jgi:uncharacterized tellurite resistance protein B-like protein